MVVQEGAVAVVVLDLCVQVGVGDQVVIVVNRLSQGWENKECHSELQFLSVLGTIDGKTVAPSSL